MAKKNSGKKTQMLHAQAKTIQHRDQKIASLAKENLELAAQIQALENQLAIAKTNIERLENEAANRTDAIQCLAESLGAARANDLSQYLDRVSVHNELAIMFPEIDKHTLRDIVDAELLYRVAKETSSCYCMAMLSYAKAVEALLSENLRQLNPSFWHKGITLGEILGPLNYVDPINPSGYQYEKIKEYRDRAAHHTNNPIRKSELTEMRKELFDLGLLRDIIDRPSKLKHRK